MTHCEIILDILKDEQWHNVLDIMRQGKPNAVNWAVRSRISDIKKKLFDKGLTIISEIDVNRQAKYKIVKQQLKQGVLL